MEMSQNFCEPYTKIVTETVQLCATNADCRHADSHFGQQNQHFGQPNQPLQLAKLATPVSQNGTLVRLPRLAISDGNGNTIYNLSVYKSAYVAHQLCITDWKSSLKHGLYSNTHLLRFNTQLNRFHRELLHISLDLELHFGSDVTSILDWNSTACTLANRTF